MAWWKRSAGSNSGEKLEGVAALNGQSLLPPVVPVADPWWPFREQETPQSHQQVPAAHWGRSQTEVAEYTEQPVVEQPVQPEEMWLAEDDTIPDVREDTPSYHETESSMPESEAPRDTELSSVAPEQNNPVTDSAELVGDDISTETTETKEETPMADYQASLNEALQIDGALGVALVDTTSGMALATAGSPPIDLTVAAAGNSSVVQAKLRTMKELGLNEPLEDILITLQSQYHIIRTLGAEDGLFLYLVLDKNKANLAMARFKLAKIEKDFSL